jgi:hypothetical protein
MQRRAFFKTAAMAGLAAPITVEKAAAYVPAHLWDKYDFGSGPPVRNRLNQGPFPRHAPELPGGSVLMVTTPAEEVVPNFGRGAVTYVTANMGLAEIVGDDKLHAIEELVRMPLGQKLYIRPTWREIQQRRGRLDLPEYVKLVFDLARKYDKRVGFRIQMMAPDYLDEALPQFILDNVPMVRLEGEWRPPRQSTVVEPRYQHPFYQAPRYDHPYFQDAFAELNGLLAAEFNGSPQVEFFDTFMYGFWGEGHTSPFRNNPFPDYRTAERTWIGMLETQLAAWTKTPLMTNVEVDSSHVGNSEMLDRTIRTHNWIRSDTIYVNNEQIDALSNRPPWIASMLEVGGAQGFVDHCEDSIPVTEGLTSTDLGIQSVMDVGSNYWSLWYRHKISAAGIMNYYQRYPKMIDQICRRLGYSVRPSFVWAFRDENPGLIIGFANDGLAGVPGVLYVSVVSDDGKVNVGGGLDPGYPLPGKVRQALFLLPQGTHWEGLKLKAELEVKGVRYPVRWATHQKTNPDGSLTLKLNRLVGPNGY